MRHVGVREFKDRGTRCSTPASRWWSNAVAARSGPASPSRLWTRRWRRRPTSRPRSRRSGSAPGWVRTSWSPPSSGKRDGPRRRRQRTGGRTPARGRALLTHPDPAWYTTVGATDGVRHEIGKRAAALVRAGRLTRDGGVDLAGRAPRLFAAAVAVVPRTAYAPLEGEARTDRGSARLVAGGAGPRARRGQLGRGSPLLRHRRAGLEHAGAAGASRPAASRPRAAGTVPCFADAPDTTP